MYFKTCAHVQEPIYASVLKMHLQAPLSVFILRLSLVIILSINLELEG